MDFAINFRHRKLWLTLSNVDLCKYRKSTTPRVGASPSSLTPASSASFKRQSGLERIAECSCAAQQMVDSLCFSWRTDKIGRSGKEDQRINDRADSRFAPSQWETALLCNNVSHWLGASLESAWICAFLRYPYTQLRKLNTLRPGQNGLCFANAFQIYFHAWNVLYLNWNVIVPSGPINNKPSVSQIMAWRQTDAKP